MGMGSVLIFMGGYVMDLSVENFYTKMAGFEEIISVEYSEVKKFVSYYAKFYPSIGIYEIGIITNDIVEFLKREFGKVVVDKPTLLKVMVGVFEHYNYFSFKNN